MGPSWPDLMIWLTMSAAVILGRLIARIAAAEDACLHPQSPDPRPFAESMRHISLPQTGGLNGVFLGLCK